MQGALTEGSTAAVFSLGKSGDHQERKSTVQHWNCLLRGAQKPPSLGAFKIRLGQAMMNQLMYLGNSCASEIPPLPPPQLLHNPVVFKTVNNVGKAEIKCIDSNPVFNFNSGILAASYKEISEDLSLLGGEAMLFATEQEQNGALNYLMEKTN